MSIVIPWGWHLQEVHTTEAVSIFIAATHNKIAAPTDMESSKVSVFYSFHWTEAPT